MCFFYRDLQLTDDHRSVLNAKHGSRPYEFTTDISRLCSVELKAEIVLMHEVQGLKKGIKFTKLQLNVLTHQKTFQISHTPK